MPTYEYLCEKCGHTFEVFQSMTADALTVCPKDRCAKKRWGRGRIRRAIGVGAGLLFKGNGFYITDYRSDNYKAAAQKDRPDTGKKTNSGNGSGKPTASPATKTATQNSGTSSSSS